MAGDAWALRLWACVLTADDESQESEGDDRLRAARTVQRFSGAAATGGGELVWRRRALVPLGATFTHQRLALQEAHDGILALGL